MPRVVVVLLVGLVAQVAVLVGGVAAPATGVAAEGAVESLKLDGFADLVVVPLTGRVFVSQGTDAVVVTDARGQQVDSLQIADATDMGLSADGLSLYVASEHSRQVTVVDTFLLSTRVLDLGTRDDDVDRCASDLAVSSGVLWVVDLCERERSRRATIVAVDPLSGDVTPTSVTGEHEVFAHPRVPGTLFVGNEVYDVTGLGTPSATPRRDAGAIYTGRPQAVTADGAHVLVVEPNGRHPLRYEVGHLGRDGSYAARDATALAVRSDGVVAAGSFDGTTRWFGEDDPDPFLVEHVTYGRPVAMAFAGRDLVEVVGTSLGSSDPPRLIVRPGPLTALPGSASPYTSGSSVLDEEHGRLLHPTDGGSLLVTDLDGTVTGTVPLMGPAGIAVVPSRSAAYVPLSTSAAIAEIDLATLAVRRIPLPRAACPKQPAFVGGLLYFVDTCAPRDGAVRASRIDALDLETGQLFVGAIEVEYPSGGVSLSASRSAPGLLLVNEGSQLRVLDVAAGFQDSAVLGRATAEAPMTFDADGRALQAGMERYRLPDLAPLGRGPCDWVAAVRADGLTVCHSTVSYDERRLSLYAPGASRRYASAWMPFAARAEVVTGVRDVYAVGNGQDGVQVVRLDPSQPTVEPLQATSYIAMATPTRMVAGETFLVRVRLDTPEPHATVTIELAAMANAGVRRVVLAQGRVDARGVLTASVTAPFAGDVEAVYAGSDGIDGARVWAPSRVADGAHAVQTPLAVMIVGARPRADGTHSYPAGARVTLVVRGPADDRGCLRLRTQARRPHGGWGRGSASSCTPVRRRVTLTVPVPRGPGKVSRTRAELVSDRGEPTVISRWVVLRQARR